MGSHLSLWGYLVTNQAWQQGQNAVVRSNDRKDNILFVNFETKLANDEEIEAVLCEVQKLFYERPYYVCISAFVYPGPVHILLIMEVT